MRSGSEKVRVTAALALAGTAVAELGYIIYVLAQIQPYHRWFYSVFAVPPLALLVAFMFGRRRATIGTILLFAFVFFLVALSSYYVHWYNRMWPGFCCGD
ncbi:MAG: hypothetical protein ACYC7A_22715 [Thermoanaerobaculia bacterium]